MKRGSNNPLVSIPCGQRHLLPSWACVSPGHEMALEELWPKGRPTGLWPRQGAVRLHSPLCKASAAFTDLAPEKVAQVGGGGEGFKVGHEAVSDL